MEVLTEEKKNTLSLSEKLIPKELKKPKMYRLINLGKVDHSAVSEATGKPVTNRNPFYITEGVEVIYDRFEKQPQDRKKIIKNITGTQLVTKEGKTYLEEKVEDVIFINGIRIVQPSEFYTYLFLERSNNNGSNPYRDPAKPAVWEEVEEAKAMSEILKDDDIRLDAENLARSFSIEEARAYAKKLNIPNYENKSSEELKWDLRQHAKQNPRDFIKGSKDNKAKRKLQISEAKHFEIIALDTENNQWVFPFEKEEKDRVICQVPIGTESPEDFLDNFFIDSKEEGKKAYEKIVKCLKNPHDFIS